MRTIVLSAHYDHFGKDETLHGDQIYNGAVDNCSASAALLATAGYYAQRPEKLKADLCFVAVTAEEQLVLGSDYFARHLPFPKETVVADINFEMTNVWGETEDVFAIGARYSDLDAVCREAAEKLGLRYTPERNGELGFFYRSDQISFARAGIPGVWLSQGVVSRGPDKGLVQRKFDGLPGDEIPQGDRRDPARLGPPRRAADHRLGPGHHLAPPGARGAAAVLADELVQTAACHTFCKIGLQPAVAPTLGPAGTVHAGMGAGKIVGVPSERNPQLEGRSRSMRRNALFFALAIPAIVAGCLSPVFAQRPPNLADKVYRDGVLLKLAGLVESKYVLADKAKGFADEFRAKCDSGAYDGLTDAKEFAEKVNADLVAITRDKHLNFRVIVSSDVGEEAAGSLHHPVRYYRLRAKENAGFYRLDWIEPGIGYIDLRRFYSFDQAKDMAVAAMVFLANARAIIVDVRENGGGSGDYLSSYFLPYPTQLSGSFSRQTGTLTEIWTRRDIGMEPRLDVPLFILTGPNTFSASESFAYDMQSRKRATLVGEPTKGGGHSVDVFAIDDLFEFYISTERSISPVTGGNWEGTGVIPDIRVPASSALDAALVEAKKAGEAYGLAKDAGLQEAVEQMQALADVAARLYREGEDREADATLDTLLKKAREAGLISQFFLEVFAYNFQSLEDERMLFAVLEKNVKLFPGSFTACDLLASVYSSRGKTELALKYFRKALELDPGDRNASKRIKELSR